MSKKDEVTGEIIEVSPRPEMAYVADKSQPSISLTKVLQEMELSGPRVPAEQLVGTTFTILRAKPFQSSFSEEGHAWFCICQAKKGGEVFTTVLGGQAVVDILDVLFATGIKNPLEVTLSQVSGGKYGRYYVLE